MVVLQQLPTPTGNIWYLAYGSNLSSSKFVKDRGIIPLDSCIVRLPGFGLTMNTAGLPYREPSFANIRPLYRDPTGKSNTGTAKHGDQLKVRSRFTLLGTSYLVTPEQYQRILATEGGGIAYREIEVTIEPIRSTAKQGLNKEDGPQCKQVARTLISVITRHPVPRPSHRYMVCDLLDSLAQGQK
jgi:gliotoxin/aspirochlorine biosynthesis gamma-glutamylcyclotransferase